MVCHAATTLTGAAVDEVVVVLSHRSDAVTGDGAYLYISTVCNGAYHEGQSTSV